jgi:cytochrome c556
MDDQFLHRLRREPPTNFAMRLKWQLDRPVPARRFRPRLLLLLALCGTAFALVSPPGRRALHEWFATTTSPPQAAPPQISSAPPSAAASTAASRRPSAADAGPPRYVAVVPSFPAPQSATVPAANEPQAGTTDTPAPARSAFAPVPIVAGSLLQPPATQALSAVLLRQGLFKTLGFVLAPLASMQRNTPLDMGVVRTSATRLATLSALIPEVFAQDTRPFELDTRALDSIWANGRDFESKADDLTLAADALAEAAASDDDDAARRAIGRIGVACTACHDVYRRK